jgi:hypothetical protein
MFIYAFASCFIAWFPSIVLVGPFLLAKVRPPTIVIRRIIIIEIKVKIVVINIRVKNLILS